MRRRDFLKTGAAALAVTPLPALGDAVRRYRIEAGPASARLGEEGAASTDLWLYNGTSPGPGITALRGETLEVNSPTGLTCRRPCTGTASVTSTRWTACPT